MVWGTDRRRVRKRPMMAMIWWVCGPEASVTRVFEDFAVGMILLFGLYCTHGITTTPTRSANWDGGRRGWLRSGYWRLDRFRGGWGWVVFPKFAILCGLGFEWPGRKNTRSLELLGIGGRGLFPFVGGGWGRGAGQGWRDGKVRWEWSRESTKDLETLTDVRWGKDEWTECPTCRFRTS